jgi:alkanesulfonate monooxygenase SsuD/methylene tetrahydromethanopterin reductase-like flavin-dependent oxidoreductase (luciferase family)
MTFDLFCGFSRMTVDGVRPSEAELFRMLTEQAVVADELGFGAIWVGEAHFSLAVEQAKPKPTLPHFPGEVCLNTDILHLAHHLFRHTKRIEVGSAIRNVLCNGGPLAHAEMVRTFLTLHGLDPRESRRLQLGFGTGRFDYANAPYGVRPRSRFEEVAWPAMRGLVLQEAAEIFVRAVSGETFSSREVAPRLLTRAHVRTEEQWEAIVEAAGERREAYAIGPFWPFDTMRLLPEEARLELLVLTLGSHDPAIQRHVNRFAPVRVFNLSVTPPAVIDATHARMAQEFHASGGPWHRSYMPRTVMVHVEDDPGLTAEEQSRRAYARAVEANRQYWLAMEGTIDEAKVAAGMSNAVVGNPSEVAEQIRARFHPDDKLMVWFDFADNDQERILRGMRAFHRAVVPRLGSHA